MHIEYVPLSPGERPELTDEAGGHGLKSILGTIASIIVPFAAPAIAGAIGLSSTLSTFVGSKLIGNAISGAITGGLLGGAASELSGGNFGQGALFGALGGGFGGASKFMGVGAGGAGATGSATSAVKPGLDVAKSMVSSPAGINAALKAEDIARFGAEAVAKPAGVVTDVVAKAEQAARQMGIGERVMNTIRSLPGQLAQRFLSRDGLAMITQMAAGALQPQAGLEEAIAARRSELETARARDIELYNLQLTTARDILNEAEHFDPQNMANRASNQAKIVGGRQEIEQLRDAAINGRNSGRREVIRRQAGLNTAREASSAYHQGWDFGESQRNAKRAAARTWLPTDYPTTNGEGVSLAMQQQAANDANIAGLSGWAGLLFEDPSKPKEPNVWGGYWGRHD